jgi:hypothetical protein
MGMKYSSAQWTVKAVTKVNNTLNLGPMLLLTDQGRYLTFFNGTAAPSLPRGLKYHVHSLENLYVGWMATLETEIPDPEAFQGYGTTVTKTIKVNGMAYFDENNNKIMVFQDNIITFKGNRIGPAEIIVETTVPESDFTKTEEATK